MNETIVVNVKREKCDVRICRNNDGSIPEAPQNGCFGNPFVLNHEWQRDRVIADYKKYFLNKIETDPIFRAAILSLRGKRLGCFCAPKACHGDIIVEWLNQNQK